jgi:hypothetical protein
MLRQWRRAVRSEQVQVESELLVQLVKRFRQSVRAVFDGVADLGVNRAAGLVALRIIFVGLQRVQIFVQHRRHTAEKGTAAGRFGGRLRRHRQRHVRGTKQRSKAR